MAVADDGVEPLLERRTAGQAPKAGYFRYVIVILISYGFVMDYLLRVNMSFAMDGGLVNCTSDENYYCWSQELQGNILSSFLWGYWVTQLPGALICYYFGAARVFWVGLSLAVIVTAFNPLAAAYSPWALGALRILVGLGQGVTFPVTLNIITNWAPVSEKGLFTSFATGGQYLGAVLADTVSGVLCQSSSLGGWSSIFYIYSVVGLIWAVAWFILVSDSPPQSRWVSRHEKEYLEESTTPAVTLPVSLIPWRRIFTCVPVLSTMTIHALNGYGFYIILIDLPKFMKEVLLFDITESGFLTSLPFIMLYLGYTSSGYMSDRLIISGTVYNTEVRKMCGVIALLLPAILMATLSFLHSTLPTLILMNIAMYFNGFANSCYFVNYMDLSPRLSAVMCSIGNAGAALIGLVGPVFIGWLVQGVPLDDHEALHRQWQIAFITASVVWTVAALQYCVFGSGELQANLEIAEEGGGGGGGGTNPNI